ncbi:MAG: hypothetical protein KGN33_02770 [Paracoccaceae bacterium]|nr:hypothetical protein [Paracoccaceae bacterium]
MAIKVMPYITVILRTQVEQPISSEGWRYLANSVDPSRNFDGEIMVFGFMGGNGVQRCIDRLTSFGFIGPDRGNQSDIVVWEGPFGPATSMVDWLSLVDVNFFDANIEPCQAWKLTNSSVYTLLDFHILENLPTKGYECDWHPNIGKIS